LLLVRPDRDELPETLEWPVRIGTLRPLDTLGGVQTRLNNLGYGCSQTGAEDDATTLAIRLFQIAHGLTASGTPDPSTLSALQQAHGS
jgi:peptidoglycan hydrolase-like protein with peptidoglycan-binding domain